MSAYLERLEDKPNARCRKWKLIVSRGSGDGRCRHTRRFAGTYREAREALACFEDELGESANTPSETLPDYMRRWSATRVAAGMIEKKTGMSYEWAANALEPHLPMPIEQVTAGAVEDALAKLRAGETPSGRNMSGTGLRDAFRLAKAALAAANRDGLIPANPLNGVRPPAASKGERKAMRPEDAAALIDRLSAESTHEFALSVLLRTGMRAGECLGVLWSDVRPEGIVVRRSVTKTDAGVRTIPLDEPARAFLEVRRMIVEDTLAKASATMDGTERLCCTEDGRPLSYNALNLWWERHRASYGLDGWVLHELRHTYLTNLAQANVHPRVMQRLAGHSCMQTTMEIYTHVHQLDMEEAVDALARIRCTNNETQRGADLGAKCTDKMQAASL